MPIEINVLIACEFSGVVRETFNSFHGVNAISCDLLPPEDGRVDYHYQGDVRDFLARHAFDAMIAFPPCTFLTNSGVRWLYNADGSKNEERWNAMREAAKFFNFLLYHPNIPKKAIENPIQHRYARQLIRKYDQIIQPYWFGHGETKQTCLWLDGLPPLKETNRVPGRKPRVHYESPSDTRWMERSRTLPGIAMAMADQWIPVILNNE